MSNSLNFGEQVGFGFVGRISTAVLGLAGTIVVARMTTPEVYGLYFLIYAVADAVNNPFGGWVEGCRKRITESQAPEDEIMGAYILGLILFTVIGVILIALAGEFGAQYIPIDGLKKHWTVLTLLFIGLNLTQQTGMILSVRSNFGYHSWIDLLKTAVKYIGQIGLVLLGYDVGGLVAGTALGLIIVAPFPFQFIGVRPRLPTRTTVRQIWTFAKPKFPQSILDTMMGRIDTILIGVLATGVFVGYYNVALRISAPAVFITQLISNGAYGDISNLHSRGEAVAERLQDSTSYSSVLAIPLFFGALILGQEILVTAYEPKYADAGVFLVLIAFYRILITQEQVFSSAINGLDMPHTSFHISLIKFITNIIGSVSLFFIIGPIGVVVGSVIAQSINYILSVYAVKMEVSSLTTVPKPLLHQFMSGGVMAVVIWGLRQVFLLRSWVSIITLVGVGAAVYGVVLLTISKHHRATLWNISGGLFGRIIP
jgi:O-antigen/teichoic acid export membrane protein